MFTRWFTNGSETKVAQLRLAPPYYLLATISVPCHVPEKKRKRKRRKAKQNKTKQNKTKQNKTKPRPNQTKNTPNETQNKTNPETKNKQKHPKRKPPKKQLMVKRGERLEYETNLRPVRHLTLFNDGISFCTLEKTYTQLTSSMRFLKRC